MYVRDITDVIHNFSSSIKAVLVHLFLKRYTNNLAYGSEFK